MWGLLGQTVVVIWAAGFVMSLLLLAYADWQEGKYERDYEEALEMDRDWEVMRVLLDRQRRLLAVADAVCAVEQDSAFQGRARRAEGLDDSWDREMGGVA